MVEKVFRATKALIKKKKKSDSGDQLLLGYARDEDIKSLFELLGMVAKANGVVQKSAIDEVNRFMTAHLSPGQKEYAIASFRTGKDSVCTPASVMRRAFQLYGFQEQGDVDPWLKPHQVMDILLRVAFSDGDYSEEEHYILDKVRETLCFHIRSFWVLRDTLAERLGINIKREGKSFAVGSGEKNQNYSSRAGNSGKSDGQKSKEVRKIHISPEEARRILQLKEGAGIKDIKIAYRKLVKLFHPDKLIKDNARESVIKEAMESFCEVQEAYECLMQAGV